METYGILFNSRNCYIIRDDDSITFKPKTDYLYNKFNQNGLISILIKQQS